MSHPFHLCQSHHLWPAVAQKIVKGIQYRTSIDYTIRYVLIHCTLSGILIDHQKGYVYPPTCGRRSQIHRVSRDECQGAFAFGCGSVVVVGDMVDTGGGLPRLPAKGEFLNIHLFWAIPIPKWDSGKLIDIRTIEYGNT